MNVTRFKDMKNTVAWYNNNAKGYADESEKRASLDEINEFSELLIPRSRVLDAGCGSGRDTALLSKEGFDVVGLDLSEGLINEAKKRNPDLKFELGNFLKLPFDDNSFNGVWAHASLVHLKTVQEVKTALSEFNRVLKKEGILHILVKAQIGPKKTAIISDKSSNYNKFFQYFTRDELKKLLEEERFKIIKLQQYKDSDKFPNGRPEVEWILTLCKKMV